MPKSPEPAGPLADPSVVQVERCQLTVSDGTWQFAEDHRDDIRRHWIKSSRDNPHIFNGVIYLAFEYGVRDATFVGRFVRTDFASYLYWRDHGFSDPTVRDCFSSVVICGERGDVLVARATDHTLNSGALVVPGGMIDERDVAPDGSIDVVQYGLRELTEETGLRPDDLEMQQGICVSHTGVLIALILVCRSHLSDATVLARVRSHNDQAADVELRDAHWASPTDERTLEQMPAFLARALRARAGTLQAR